MTNFNPEGGFKNIETWESIAEKRAGNTGAASRIIGGILIGGLGVSMGAEILGGVVAAWLLKSAWDALSKAGKRLALVRDMGCNAFVLDEHDFRTYLKQFGDETVYRELAHVEAQGEELSNSSANWLSTFRKSKGLTPTQEVKAIGKATDRASVTALVPVNPTNPINPAKTIKNAVINVFNPKELAQIDIISEMTDRITNTIVVGVPGSGKGMLISNAIREAIKKHPDLKIFVIDPKADPKEAGYFNIDGLVVEKYACMDAKPGTVAVWAERAFDLYAEYARNNPRTLLILDEGTMLGNKLGQAKSTLLIDKLTALTSGGDSAGRNVWFMAQSPYVGASSLNLSTSSQMLTIVIASQENIGALSQWKSAKTINFKSLSLDAISELINSSDTGRAVYFGKTGQWYMMPKLTNYSGYDRDKREYLAGYEAPTNIQNLEDSFKASDNISESVIQPPPLTDKVIEILSRSENSMSLNAIRISKIWEREFNMTLPSRSDVREVVEQLIEDGFVEGNEGVGYRLTNNN